MFGRARAEIDWGIHFWGDTRDFSSGLRSPACRAGCTLVVFCSERQYFVLRLSRMEDAASAACQTKFAGNRDAAAEEITRRLEGLTPLNLSNIHMNAESPNAAAELQPSMVQARATKLLTESSGALVQTNDGPLAPFATSLLLKFVSEAVNQLLDQQRDAVAQSCGGI